MKGLTKALKIIVIVLNAIFLAGILFGMSRFGVNHQGLHDWAGCIFILVFPAVTLITIALTFHKKAKMPASVLRIIAIIVNVFFLIILISAIISAIALERFYNQEFAQWLICLMGLGLPVLNLLVLALTLRKAKENTSNALC